MANNECPLCGKEKQAKHVVCNECYSLYTNQAGKTLAREGKIIPFTTWAKGEVEKRFQDLQNQLTQKKKEYEDLQGIVASEAFQSLVDSLHGEKVQDAIFRNALFEKKKEFWKKKGGNRLHYELKNLEAKFSFLEQLFQELQVKAESLSEPSEPLADQ